MTETFACPECGDEVTLLGATPGREVQCSRCSTWIEVPYFPRSGVWTRPRFKGSKNRWLIPLAWSGVGLFALAIALFAGVRYFASQNRSARDVGLQEFLRAAASAEKSGRPDRALSEIEAALAFLRKTDSLDAEQLDQLKRRRDGLSVREAEARIEKSVRLDPKSAVGDLLALQKRAHGDRALDGLASVILEAVDAARRRQVSAELHAGQKAAEDKKPFEAIAFIESALTVADKIDAPAFRSAMSEGESILGPILNRRGVIIAQTPGQFSFGSIDSYASGVMPHLIDALRQQGYATRPARGPAAILWDRRAGYRFELQTMETLGGFYMQSRNRMSEIGLRLRLQKGSATVWESRIATRTQVPLPDLPAFVASRLAVSDHHSPELEHMLYDDAFASLVLQIDSVIKGVPSL